MSLVKDSVTPGHSQYNEKAARAKLMGRLSPAGLSLQWGPGVDANLLAHDDDKMAYSTCHLSWTTSCAGCHLPIQANWKSERLHHDVNRVVRQHREGLRGTASTRAATPRRTSRGCARGYR